MSNEEKGVTIESFKISQFFAYCLRQTRFTQQIILEELQNTLIDTQNMEVNEEQLNTSQTAQCKEQDKDEELGE